MKIAKTVNFYHLDASEQVFIRTIGIRKVAHKSGVDQAYISRWVNCKMALGEKVCARILSAARMLERSHT